MFMIFCKEFSLLIILHLLTFIRTDTNNVCVRQPPFTFQQEQGDDLIKRHTTLNHGFNFLRYNPKSSQLVVHEINNIPNVNAITIDQITDLKQQILKHGVVKIPNQKMTHKQHMEFSKKLGEISGLPEAFRGKDSVPGFPHISPVRNYWSNGTWKGKSYSFGQYWHKDGNFFTFDKGYILSILYADEIEEGIVGGETAFIDGCKLKQRLPPDMKEELKNKTQTVSVRQIKDFMKKATKEELDAFPPVNHKIFFKHPGKDEECVFGVLILPPYHDDKFTNTILRMWNFMQDPRFVMKQSWKSGDIIIWDNYGVFHRAMPLVSNQKRRILYRTQIRLKVNMD